VSSFTDYDQISRHYDTTRQAIGVEIIVGCFARGPRQLNEMVVLDAGCGSGTYTQELLHGVRRVEAVDLSQGMLDAAAHKLRQEQRQGRVAFHRAALDRLPLSDSSVDGVMVNQVLHHLEEDSADYQSHGRVLCDLARVLKPGGTLTINTCSHEQLQGSYWYFHLLPARIIDDVIRRMIPLPTLIELLGEVGFSFRGSIVPTDAVLQGEAYFTPCGPLDRTWRDGDSTWSLLSEAELNEVRDRVRALEKKGELAEFVARHDARRTSLGQVTFLHAQRND